MSAADAHSIADVTVMTLKCMRSDESFQLFYNLVNTNHHKMGVVEPALPRKRRIPSSLKSVLVLAFRLLLLWTTTVASIMKLLMLKFLASLIDLINQGIYENLEELLVNAARGKEYEDYYEKGISFYKDDMNAAELQVQLQNLGTWFASKGSDQATIQLK